MFVQKLFGEIEIPNSIKLTKVENENRYFDLTIPNEKVRNLLLHNPWLLHLNQFMLTNVSIHNCKDPMLSKYISNDLERIIILPTEVEKGYSLYKFKLVKESNLYRLYLEDRELIKGDELNFPFSINATPVDVSKKVDAKIPTKAPIGTKFDINVEKDLETKILIGEYALPFLEEESNVEELEVFVTYLTIRKYLDPGKRQLTLEKVKQFIILHDVKKDLSTSILFRLNALRILKNIDLNDYRDDPEQEELTTIIELNNEYYYSQQLEQHTLKNIFHKETPVKSHDVTIDTFLPRNETEVGNIHRITFPNNKIIFVRKDDLEITKELYLKSIVSDGIEKDLYISMKNTLYIPNVDNEIFIKLHKQDLSIRGKSAMMERTQALGMFALYKVNKSVLIPTIKQKYKNMFENSEETLTKNKYYIYKSLVTSRLLFSESGKEDIFSTKRKKQGMVQQYEDYDPIIYNIRSLCFIHNYNSIKITPFKIYRTKDPYTIRLKYKPYLINTDLENMIKKSLNNLNMDFEIETKSEEFNILQMIKNDFDINKLCFNMTFDNIRDLYNSSMNPLNVREFSNSSTDIDLYEFFVNICCGNHKDEHSNALRHTISYLINSINSSYIHYPYEFMFDEKDVIQMLKDITTFCHADMPKQS